MMPRLQITLVCLLLLTIVNACANPGPKAASEPSATTAASPATQKITSESVVKVAAQSVQIPAGGTAEAIVRVTIQSGYHINANPPTFSYLKATALEIPAANGVASVTVNYPKALTKQFAFADKPLAVYEGEAEIKATLKADKAAKTGERSLPAHLRIQACDDQVCYAPGTLELTIPVNIR
jgi:DsbC/DsbD-like thiol-disulfide interchange protein